ncbi:Hpt domain-containing protein [Rhizorhabdus argentea]|uniref:Hpt domain-containing protein n=1 Tax=Rhizorhabdus argentea TaxID=1387174 RepID=UPI0030EEC226
MGQTGNGVVNWTTFGQTRALIGNDFAKILGYYRDDAAKCVVAVEQAYKLRDAISMVRPAHTLKGDSLQFGGEALGKLAEHIEHSARRCVEEHSAPDSLDTEILRLRPMLIETLAHFERELTNNAVPMRRPAVSAGFGRKQG